jgi:NAD(P)-dependent dehydrogenase (short-subunit alcohol dehydrogenase family)
VRNGKTALVTGSSKGIGAGVALALAADGYDIAVHYSSSEKQALEVKAQIETMGVHACLLQGDTSDAEVPGRLVQETVSALGRLDVLVNNAGITLMEELREITPEVMDKLYRINYRGMILGAGAAARYMVENEIRGSIIFNTSIRSFAPHSSDGIYGGLKAGLNRTIRSFAIDLGRYGIRVNGFSPGVTNVMCPDPEEEAANPFYKYTHKYIPLRRNGYAADMGNAVSFLASDKASYITGQVLCVDGGLSIVGAPEHLMDLFNAFDVQDIVNAPDWSPETFREEMQAFMRKLKKDS